MARPQKKGLDYFPLDVNMDLVDDDISILEAKYGIEGFCILIKLYMKIYQDEGYFIKWNEKASLLHSKRVNVDFNQVNDVINDLVEWDVFNQKLFEEYSILTSSRIQETYVEAIKKRKSVDMVDSLYLLEEVNSNINLVNSDIYPQRKEEKSKVKEKKIIVNKFDDLINNATSDEGLKKAMIDFMDMRKSVRKPMTERAITLMFGKLNKMTTNINEQIEILEQSTMNNWQGIFELKQNNSTNGKSEFRKQIDAMEGW